MRADQERELIAAVQRACIASTPAGEHRIRARGGEAREHREPERAAHHERGVDDAGGEAGFARAHVAHRAQQQRVERDAGADAEQHHAGQHVDEESAVERRAREQREAGRGEQQSARKRSRECRSA